MMAAPQMNFGAPMGMPMGGIPPGLSGGIAAGNIFTPEQQ